VTSLAITSRACRPANIRAWEVISTSMASPLFFWWRQMLGAALSSWLPASRSSRSATSCSGPTPAMVISANCSRLKP